MDANARSASRSTAGGCPPRWPWTTFAHRPAELVSRRTQQVHDVALAPEAHRRSQRDVIEHTENADNRGRMDGRCIGLVVEADVPPGDRYPEGLTGVGQASYGLRELPHHARIRRRTKEAVRHRRPSTGDSDIAVRLGEGKLRAGVRIEPGETTVAVYRDRDAQVRRLVDSQHTGVLRLGKHGVATHVPVVLVGDPGPIAQVRCSRHPQQRPRSSSPVVGAPVDRESARSTSSSAGG